MPTRRTQPLLKAIEDLLAKASQQLTLAEYEDLLEEIAGSVEGRLEGLAADRREAGDDEEE